MCYDGTRHESNSVSVKVMIISALHTQRVVLEIIIRVYMNLLSCGNISETVMVTLVSAEMHS